MGRGAAEYGTRKRTKRRIAEKDRKEESRKG